MLNKDTFIMRQISKLLNHLFTTFQSAIFQNKLHILNLLLISNILVPILNLVNFPFNLSNWRNDIFQSCELISLDREANPKLWVSPRNLEKSLFSRLSKIYWSEPLLYFTPNTPKKRVHNYFLYSKYPQKACSWLSISNSLLWN